MKLSTYQVIASIRANFLLRQRLNSSINLWREIFPAFAFQLSQLEGNWISNICHPEQICVMVLEEGKWLPSGDQRLKILPNKLLVNSIVPINSIVVLELQLLALLTLQQLVQVAVQNFCVLKLKVLPAKHHFMSCAIPLRLLREISWKESNQQQLHADSHW